MIKEKKKTEKLLQLSKKRNKIINNIINNIDKNVPLN